MAFCRSDTEQTMASRANSTSELSRGLSHILFDTHGKLPDDPAQLEDWSLQCSVRFNFLSCVDSLIRFGSQFL